MRKILSISLPAKMLRYLKQGAKAANMNVSAYVRHILLDFEEEATADDFVAELQKAECDLQAGRYRDISSADELLQ